MRLIPHCLCDVTGTKEHASASSSPHAGMCNANRIPQLNFTNPSDTFKKAVNTPLKLQRGLYAHMQSMSFSICWRLEVSFLQE